MMSTTLVLLFSMVIFAPLQLWQGTLLLPLACAIVGSAFGAWRFVFLWVAVFLLFALTRAFPWFELFTLLLAIGVTSFIVTRFVDREHGVIMTALLSVVFLCALWIQSALLVSRVYHPSMVGSFVLTIPFIVVMVAWFTYPVRRLM